MKALRAEPAIPCLTDAIGPSHETRWRKALARLREARLILEDKEGGTLDAHPLVRAYFREEIEKHRLEAWREGNLRLYEYLKGAAPEFPETLEVMEPLFAAVVHGCRAGRQDEAFLTVYLLRIQRWSELYATRKLGAFGSELTALAGFFDHSWNRPSAHLSPRYQGSLLNEVGFDLRALGRLAEAVQPMKAALESAVKQEDWEHASIGASNLSELTLTLGEMSSALDFGKQSVKWADRRGDTLQRTGSRVVYADALHQAGQWEQSAKAFHEAEAMQTCALVGFNYCNFLLSQAEAEDGAGLVELAVVPEQEQRVREACQKVRARVEQFFEWRGPSDSILGIALDHLTLGRAYLGLALTVPSGEKAEADFTQSAEHLGHAMDSLRQTAQEQYLPAGLLARAALRRFQGDLDSAVADLTEALEIAEGGSMRLFACDAHIEWARLCLQEGDAEAARGHLVLARKLVNETGYGRREREVGWLERKVGTL